jgi:hypothetical protein
MMADAAPRPTRARSLGWLLVHMAKLYPKFDGNVNLDLSYPRRVRRLIID